MFYKARWRFLQKDKGKVMKYILDASAIISGVAAEGVIAQSVVEEIREENLRLKLEIALREGSLKILTPEKKYIEKVKIVSQSTGDSILLSKADIELLALAIQLGEGYIIMSDDYALQNLAEVLKLKYLGIKENGIEKVFIWRNYCRSCKKEYPLGYTSSCDVCGGRVVRKLRKRLNKK